MRPSWRGNSALGLPWQTGSHDSLEVAANDTLYAHLLQSLLRQQVTPGNNVAQELRATGGRNKRREDENSVHTSRLHTCKARAHCRLVTRANSPPPSFVRSTGTHTMLAATCCSLDNTAASSASTAVLAASLSPGSTYRSSCCTALSARSWPSTDTGSQATLPKVRVKAGTATRRTRLGSSVPSPSAAAARAFASASGSVHELSLASDEAEAS